MSAAPSPRAGAAGHTPGPWRVSGLPRQYAEAINADGPETIAWLPRDGEVAKRSDDEVDANARLIAAAPDLLAACLAVVGAWEDARELHRLTLSDKSLIGDAVSKARAALASARAEAGKGGA